MRCGCFVAARQGVTGRASGEAGSTTAARHEALSVRWEASDRVRGKRPLLPELVEAIERPGHRQLAPEVRTSVLAMRATTIDRALRAVQDPAGGKKRRRTPPSAAGRRSVVGMADRAVGVEQPAPTVPTLQEFLAGLCTAGQDDGKDSVHAFTQARL